MTVSIKSLLSLVFALAMVFTSGLALGVEVDNLYTGKILVTDKTQKTRIKAHRWAIEQVLAKVTGNREFLNDKKIQREVRLRTANYIKSFTFVTDEQDRIFLVDEFDQKKINQLLRDTGASIWGKRRPQTLIWLVIEEGLGRNIVMQSSYPQLSEMILQSSDDRGLPVSLPTETGHKSAGLYSSDIWAKFEHVVDKASAGYGVDNYVMARMYYIQSRLSSEKTQEGNQSGWQLEFQLMKGLDILYQGQALGEQFEVIRQMSDNLADYFASQYAIKSEKLGSDDIYLTVTGVKSLVSLVNIERHLKALPPVSHVEMQALHRQQAEFRLELSGEGLDVIKALALLPDFKQILTPKQDEEKQTLSVEQQLEKLVQDYYRQINEPEQTQTKDKSKGVDAKQAGQVRLKYQWRGKA